MGVTWQEFWGMNPRIINCIKQGYIEKIRQQDYLQHLWWGTYGISALTTSIEHCFCEKGKKTKTKYLEKPVLLKTVENAKLTEEQQYEKELQKAILIEEQWIKASRKKGLPETIF